MVIKGEMNIELLGKVAYTTKETLAGADVVVLIDIFVHYDAIFTFDYNLMIVSIILGSVPVAYWLVMHTQPLA